MPAYAWSWLQRSRPVMAEVVRRLSGEAATPEFAEQLRARFASDAFTRAIVCDVVAEVAFAGRVPPRRPPGVSWDRGLVWWAATLTGVSPSEYDRPPPIGTQAPLFGGDDPPAPAAAEALAPAATGGPAPARSERAALAAALRALLAASDGSSVPAEAVRALLADLERD